MTCKTRVPSIVLFAALLMCAPARVFAITAAQWLADLQYLVARLETTHPNLFFHVSAQDFNAAVNNLNQSIPHLSDDQITVGIYEAGRHGRRRPHRGVLAIVRRSANQVQMV